MLLYPRFAYSTNSFNSTTTTKPKEKYLQHPTFCSNICKKLQGMTRGLVQVGNLQYLREGQAAGDMLDRGHNRQWVINMGDRLIWPMTRKGRLYYNG